MENDHYYYKYKCEVAIKAIKEEKTISQLSKDYNINQKYIISWKKRALENLQYIFLLTDREICDSLNRKYTKTELLSKIGEMRIEYDNLLKKYQTLLDK